MKNATAYKITGYALACAGAAVAAPALAPLLACAGAKELLGASISALFAEGGLGKVALGAIGGFAIEFGGSAFEKLPAAWRHEGNNDLEKALAESWHKALNEIALPANDDDDEALQSQWREWQPLWINRIKRAQQSDDVATLFLHAHDTAGETTKDYVLLLGDEDNANLFMAKALVQALPRWAEEQRGFTAQRTQTLQLSEAVKPLPATLQTFLVNKAPAEVAYQFGLIVRDDEFNKSWIAWQQAHTLSVSQVLATVAGDTAAMRQRLDELAQSNQYLNANANALAECLALARKTRQEQEDYARAAATQLRDVRDSILTALDQQTVTLTAELKASAQHVVTNVVTNLNAGFDRLTKTMEAKGSVTPPTSPPSPPDLRTYFEQCIAEWSHKRYALDRRFVNLTLQVEAYDEKRERQFRDDPQWQSFQDLDKLLAERPKDRAIVVWGEPGCGKSTLLRHLQLVHSRQQLAGKGDQISFYVQLGRYDQRQTPREWLLAQWSERYEHLQPLADYLKNGKALLLLDALNEMKPASRMVEMVKAWKDFIEEATKKPNQLVFTCRLADYVDLSRTDGVTVPRVRVQELSDEKQDEFIAAYAREQSSALLRELDRDRRLREFYKNPYFLRLLCTLVKESGEVPQGRASLFTLYVRKLLRRELDFLTSEELASAALLHERDRQKIEDYGQSVAPPFDLPERGLLIPKLSELAFARRDDQGQPNFGSFTDDEAAAALAGHPATETILKAGATCSVLDDDREQYKFFHQLLQEYFAARSLSRVPLTEAAVLVARDWEADKLAHELADRAKNSPLPELKTTGWEEATVIAAPMAKSPNEFIRQLMPANLVLAARCARSAEFKLDDQLKTELQTALRSRMEDYQRADVRARIAAGEQLGWLGDTRFMRHQGKHADYLLPPFSKTIAAGDFPAGLKGRPNNVELNPAEVKLNAFIIAAYPVTNAEYRLFIEANGYQDERWWDTPAALHWLKHGDTEGQKEGLRQRWRYWQDNFTDESFAAAARAQREPEEAEVLIAFRQQTEEELNASLAEEFQDAKPSTEPEFWQDARFSHPSQPVVGVTWYEARAYCHWLTATVGDWRVFRLPTETEFEAAARGKQGRLYPYEGDFDVTKSNTFESGIRRTTPVGIFDNATPEGAYDLSGNVYTWTLSPYHDKVFDTADDHIDLTTNDNRVLRGGSWLINDVVARAADRDGNHPASRYSVVGFRVVVVRPPSALL